MKAGSLDIMDPSASNRIRNKRIDFLKTGLIVVLIVVTVGLAIKLAMRSGGRNAENEDAGSNFGRPLPAPPYKVLIRYIFSRNVQHATDSHFRKRRPCARPSTAWAPRTDSTPT